MKIRSIDQMPPITGISLICLWLILWGCVTLTRPLLPIDETRCVSVAWEMWQSGNFLVPHSMEFHTAINPRFYAG